MVENTNLSDTPLPMFAQTTEEPTWMSYPWKVLRFMGLCVVAPILVCWLAIAILLQFVVQLPLLPSKVHAQQLHRKERRIELQRAGRLISWVDF